MHDTASKRAGASENVSGEHCPICTHTHKFIGLPSNRKTMTSQSGVQQNAPHKAHRRLHHSTLGLRLMKKKRRLGLNKTPAHTLPRVMGSPLLVAPWPLWIAGEYNTCTRQRFQGGLVFKVQRLLYHSTLGWRVIKKKKRPGASENDRVQHPLLLLVNLFIDLT